MDNKELLEIIKASESTDLQILLTAKENLKREILENSTAEKLRAYDKVVKMLEDKLAVGEEEKIFNNTLSALEHLNKIGFKIAKSKIYKDIKNGLLKKESNGTVKLSAVNRYIEHPNSKLAKQAEVVPDNDDVVELHQQKLQHEVDRMDIQKQLQEIQLKKELGKYIPKESFEQELAARAGVIDAGLRQMMYTKAPEIIALVKGRPEMATALVEFLSLAVDDLVNDYANNTTFHVLFDFGEGD